MLWGAKLGLIVSERILGLGDANRQRTKTVFLQLCQLASGPRREIDAVCAVDAFGHCLDSALDRSARGVAKIEMVGLIHQAKHLLRQLLAASPALGPHLRKAYVDALGLESIGHQRKFRLGICGEAIDGNHAGQAIDVRHVGDVAGKVGDACCQRIQVLLAQLVLGHAAVVFESTNRGHHHYRIGLEATHAAGDVQELLRA